MAWAVRSSMSMLPEDPRRNQLLSKTPIGWWFPGALVFALGLVLRAIVINNANMNVELAMGAFTQSGPSAGSITYVLAGETSVAMMAVGSAMVVIAYYAMLRDSR